MNICTTRKAAELLGVSQKTVQLWVENGVLNAWKTEGGHRRIYLDSINELIQKRGLNVDQLSASEDSKVKILLVEDEPDLLNLYVMYLEQWDLPIKIISATNGIEGLLLLGAMQPDILITDLNMPEMNGFKMLKILSQQPEYKQLYIIVITAFDNDDIENQGGLPDDVNVFPKPIPFDKLEILLKKQVAEILSVNSISRRRVISGPE